MENCLLVFAVCLEEFQCLRQFCHHITSYLISSNLTTKMAETIYLRIQYIALLSFLVHETYSFTMGNDLNSLVG